MATFAATVREAYAIRNRGLVVVAEVEEGTPPPVGALVGVHPPDGRTLSARIAGYAPARRAGATDILLEGLTRADSPKGTRIVGAPPAHAPHRP
jgi:hypothetical protein